MGLYYRLDHKKTTSQLDKNEEVRVVIDYYYNGKRTKITTNVSCLVKDWDKKWRDKTTKNLNKKPPPPFPKNRKIK